MGEFGIVPGKGIIRASDERLARRVSKNDKISVRTEKELNPGDYKVKVESVRVSNNCPSEYRKMVESV